MMKTSDYSIKSRRQVLINTDPQRRCYNGCHYSSELRWTPWTTLEIGIPEDRVKRRLCFWRELNDYAVSQRGKSALCEFEDEEHHELLTA